MKGVLIALTIALVIAIRKMHDMNYQRILLFYILVINVLANLELGFQINYQPGNQSDIFFFGSLVCSFLVRINSFFSVALICIASTISYCAISYNNLIYNQTSEITTMTTSQAFWFNTE
jgi:uncharacterized membrane protein YhaH (DUF805 family)